MPSTAPLTPSAQQCAPLALLIAKCHFACLARLSVGRASHTSNCKSQQTCVPAKSTYCPCGQQDTLDDLRQH